jgi:hypothetical protein
LLLLYLITSGSAVLTATTAATAITAATATATATTTATTITTRIYVSRHNYFFMVITAIITVIDNFILPFGLWGSCRDYLSIVV